MLGELPRARSNDLADALSMDQTTLSRTLKLMEGEGLIARVAGADRRESRWVATQRGRDRLRRALPHWQAAQQNFENSLGLATARQLAAAALAITAQAAR